MAKTTDELFAEATEADYETAEPVTLAASDTEEEFQFRIDEYLRTIAIPEKGVVAGVEGDLNVNVARFKMTRYYHGRDLSKLNIRINYRNANGQVNYYTVSDATVSGDSIVFSWEFAADVTQYKGNVQFVVYLLSATNAVLKQRFFTTLGTLEVLEGLEVDSSIPVSEQTDILLHLKKDLSAYAEEVKKSLPADYTAMTEQVSSLKEDLSDLCGNQIKANANKSANLLVTSFTNIYFLNFDNVIKSGDKITVRATTDTENANSTLKIYIAEKTDTKKCILREIIEHNFVGVLFEKTLNISEYSNVVVGLSGAILFTQNTDKTIASAIPKAIGETISVYLDSEFNIDYNASVSVSFDLEEISKKSKTDKRVVTVSADGNKDFTKITAAVEYATPLTNSENPITILIYPGTYKETVNIQNKNLSLVGVNKKDCIIFNDLGGYDDAPIFASGNFYIANLTIKATHSGTPDFVENRVNDYTIGAYGIHVDNANYSDETEKLGIIENCIIYSAQNQAIGMGMAKNCKYIIRNCELINDTPDRMYELYSRCIKTGAFGCHRGYFNGSNYYQILEVSNCILKVNKGVSIQLGPFTKDGTGMEEHFYNNMLWSGTLGKSDNSIGTYAESPYTTYELADDCYGNNVSALNK